MISQSGNVAVNALGSRRGIGFHTVALDRQPGRARRERLARGPLPSATECARSRCSSRPTATARGSPRRSRCAPSAASASPCSRSAPRRPGARAAVGPHRRARRRPAGLPGPGRGGRRAPGRATPHELLELARVLAEPRARPRGDGGLAVLTCSGGDSGIAADEAERLGAELPAARRRRPRERLAELLPDGGDDRQPARLHGDDLGRHRPAAADHGRRRRRPGDRPAAALLRPPAGPRARGGGRAGPRSARGSSPAPTRPRPRRSSPRPSPT